MPSTPVRTSEIETKALAESEEMSANPLVPKLESGVPSGLSRPTVRVAVEKSELWPASTIWPSAWVAVTRGVNC